MTRSPPIPGYNVPAVEAWITVNIPDLTLPLVWTQLEGGHSNLTYRLDDARGKLAVIRRPPLGELLPKAHDMSREWALISGLAGTGVPVPRALGFCEDAAVTGAPFYIMGHIDGRPLYNAEDTASLVPPDRREAMAFSFIDALAALHAIDPQDIGLGGLGKSEGYIARQLKTWGRSWRASVEPAGLDDPRFYTLEQFFLDNVPAQGPGRIVHGDFGVHNCLIGPDGVVIAVVDWEISTLGDPLADLAYALNVWPDPSDGFPLNPASATSLPGFPTRMELAARYQKLTGCDLTHLIYFMGFNRWKSAAINHGVYARYMEGKKSSEGVDLEALRATIDRSLVLAEQAMTRIS